MDQPGVLDLMLVFRAILAGTFLVAGVAKLRDWQATLVSMEGLGLPAWATKWTSRYLPWLELSIAALLVINDTAWFGALAAACIMTAFTGLLVANLARGKHPDCFCFGTASKPISWFSVARNATLMSISTTLVIEGLLSRADSCGLGCFTSPSLGVVLTVIGLLILLAINCLVSWYVVQLTRQAGDFARRLRIVEDQMRDYPGVQPPALNLQPSGWQNLTALDSNGDRVSLGSIIASCPQGALIIATSGRCQACIELYAELPALVAGSKPQKLLVVLESDALHPVGGHIRPRELIWLRDDGQGARDLQITRFPSAVLVDGSGEMQSNVVSGVVSVRTLLQLVLFDRVP